jgi:uncharacterized protein
MPGIVDSVLISLNGCRQGSKGTFINEGRVMKYAGWIILGWLLFGPASAASFDCAKAQTNVEKLICADDGLSKLDESLEAQYQQALKRPDIKRQVVESQRDWLKNARDICQTGECVKKAYDTRIKQLGLTASFGIVIMSLPPGSKRSAAGASAPSAERAAPPAPAGRAG